MLGMLSTESFSSERFTNVRQKVFYFYPNGAAPLTGLLSLMKEETTNDPEFSGYEKRLIEQRSTTASQGSSKGPFFAADGTTDLGDNQTITADTSYVVKVADSTIFRTGHQIKIPVSRQNITPLSDVIGIVTEQPSVTDAGNTKVKFRALNTVTLVENGTTNENVGREVWVVGSAYAQGTQSNNEEIYNLPVNVGNYCQIFKTPFLMTGSALKTSAKYDDSGPYKDKAKEHSVLHMIEMEKSFLFGIKRKYVASGLPTYTSGGVISHYLPLWEAGSTYGNSAATVDTDDNKRIIENASGTMNRKLYAKYMERLFRVTNNTSNEKLCLIGSGALSVIAQMFENTVGFTATPGSKVTFGMDIVTHVTPFGTIHYKSHPLFSQNATMRFNALFLDVPNLKYRYLEGRDTELLKDRQPNDADYRKDEWLTECGLEVQFPESHMYIKNILDYVP